MSLLCNTAFLTPGPHPVIGGLGDGIRAPRGAADTASRPLATGEIEEQTEWAVD
jgi:hypothetical protein